MFVKLTCSRCERQQGCRFRYGDGVTAAEIGQRIESGHTVSDVLRDYPALSVHDLRDAIERYVSCASAETSQGAKAAVGIQQLLAESASAQSVTEQDESVLPPRRVAGVGRR